MVRPKLFTIAPHAPFLPTLVEAIGNGRLPCPASGPFGLADLTILVPTRRARTALADSLLDAAGSALLLPDIRALGDTDAAELPFLPPYDADRLPTPIGLMERRLTLAQLVAQWIAAEDGTAFNPSGFASPPSPGEILALSDSLGALIDSCHTEGVSPVAFRGLATDRDLADHWQRALKFLDIALMAWPEHLAEIGKADAMKVRDLALDRLTMAVPVLFGDRPVIAAGSTGSVPATARLLAAIARLPNGAVVLPGFDTSMTEQMHRDLLDAGNAPHGHPQYGLARLLDRLGAAAGEVEELAPSPSACTALVRHALALAEETGHWSETRVSTEADEALGTISILAARTEDEEARAIACAARAAAGTGQLVGIVTPDRNLARRIGAELRRFGIAVDDAAGTPLHQSRAGRLMRSAIAVVAENWAAVPLVALLRNRHVSLGRPRSEIRQLTDALEFGLLRGQRLAPGPDGLRAGIAVSARNELDHPARRLTADERDAISGLVAGLEGALVSLTRLFAGPAFSAADLALALGQTHLVLTGSEDGVTPEGSDVLLRWVEELKALPGTGPRFSGRHLAEAFEGLTAGLSVRAPAPETVGVSILGLLEARLLSFDLVILAGLNEGIWPAPADPGPWLSRNMAIALGLEPEERRQGQSAHDFEMALGAPSIILAYAERIGTSPAVLSRLVQRLEAYADEPVATSLRQRGAVHVDAARALDSAAHIVPAVRPMPLPPASLRPRSLAVTDIEKLIRSPYELYAKYVLGLTRVDALGADADLSERGSLIHAVMAAVVEAKIDPTAPDALDQLLAEADRVFAGLETLPARRAIWRRRLRIQGAKFLEFEAGRMPRVVARHVEISGKWAFPVEGVSFELRGRADRIDELADGSYEIIDFKTGSVPQAKEMKDLLAPQLLAEAKMLAGGGFGPGLPAGQASALTYLRLPADPKGFEPISFVPPDDMDLRAAIEALHASLQSRIAAYLLRDDQAMAPDILPRQQKTYEGDYDHLSRQAEWAATEDVEDEG
jgi:ATP-dependent helicase/nuclease subunit B